MDSSKTILFLYTELAAYVLDCFKALGGSGVDVHVVMYPVNPEAPFKLNLDVENCTFYDRRITDLPQMTELTNRLKPDAIVCSGWIDREYLQLVRAFRDKTHTVLAIDSKDVIGLKGWLSLIRARLLYKPLFQFTWVPGEPQRDYALKLGFEKERIHLGFYTTDVDRYLKIDWSNQASFPKRFVFVGRYVNFKGIKELWQAFTEIDRKGWVLDCAGTGPEFNERTIAEGISHLGFVQPSDLDKFVAAGGVFVLPSHKEPWGVVVHEFAASGYPMVCSDTVGSASQFIHPSQNGLLIKPKSVESMKEAFEFFIKSEDSDLWKMSEMSRELSKKISIQNWVDTAKKLMNTTLK